MGFYVISVDFIVLLAVVFALLRKWVRLDRLKKQIPIPLTATPPSANHFGTDDLGQLAEEYFSAFRRAADRHVLSQFDVLRNMEPLSIALRSFSSTPRAVAGILILGALFVTLVNLQSAVGNLGQTFKTVADSSSAPASGGNPTDLIATVQMSMSRVADTAAQAFYLSAVVISTVLILLFSSLASQRRALQTLLRFTNWALFVYNVRVAEIAQGTAEEQRADFGEAIQGFREVVKAFDGLRGDLGEIGSFRADLIDASTAIQDAVGQLPNQISGNIDAISTNAAREIASSLGKYFDYLPQILAIYGDQEMRLKELSILVQAVVQQNERSARSLASLEGIGVELQKLNRGIDDWANLIVRFNAVAEQLDKKVAEFPIVDISEAARDLKAGLETIRRMEDLTSQIHLEWQAFLEDSRAKDESERRAVVFQLGAAIEALDHKLEKLAILDQIENSTKSGFQQQSNTMREVNEASAKAIEKLEELRQLVGTSAKTTELTDLLMRLDEVQRLAGQSIWRRMW